MAAADNKITKARHILEINTVEKRKFLDSFDYVLCDCDGVLWVSIHPILNAGEALMLLRNQGKQLKFISNNSHRTDERYISKLNDMGVKDVQSADLVHPVKTIVRYIKKNMPDKNFFSLCSRLVNEEFIKQGIKVITTEPSTTLQTVDLAAAVKPTHDISAVIMDINFNLTYIELACALQYLSNPNCLLIVGGTDKYVPIEKNLTTIGSAGFVNLLCDYSGKTPIVLGKPSRLLGNDLAELYGITDTKRVLMIGDSLIGDIQFGIDAGFQTLLVLSGCSTKEEMLKLPDESKPDYIADSLADFLTLNQMLDA